MDHLKGRAAHGPGVGDVMTSTVVTVVGDTPYREVVGTMIAHDLDAIPVIDHAGRPVGVITDGDMLPKLEFRCGTYLPPLVAGPRTRARWRKAAGLTAADVMTTPVVGILADAPLDDAILGLTNGHRRLLCVIDATGRLVGVVTHRDVLRVFLRGDAALEHDIVDLMPHTAHERHLVTVHVADGVATLDGELQFRSMSELAGRLAGGVPGIVAVRNNLRYDFDDLSITGL